MKNTALYVKQLNALIRKLKKVGPSELPQAENPVDLCIRAFLLWETTSRQAELAYAKLMKHVVDYNDLRVTSTPDLVAIIGPRFARAEERIARLRSALHEIFMREHSVTLDQLADLSKRDARAYLDSLPGMVPFVSASVVLLSLSGHAIPVDEQLVARLIKDGVLAPETTVEQAQAFLEYHIKAANALETCALLRTCIEMPSPKSEAKEKKPSKATTKKKTSKKKTAKSDAGSSRSSSKKTASRKK